MKRRILMGTYALSAGYYDAYYKRAQQVRSAGTLSPLTARPSNSSTLDFAQASLQART